MLIIFHGHTKGFGDFIMNRVIWGISHYHFLINERKKQQFICYKLVFCEIVILELYGLDISLYIELTLYLNQL